MKGKTEEYQILIEVKSIFPLCLSQEKKSGFGKDDKLDLAGLLNVLDGVIDTPNRIIVMVSIMRAIWIVPRLKLLL